MCTHNWYSFTIRESIAKPLFSFNLKDYVLIQNIDGTVNLVNFYRLSLSFVIDFSIAYIGPSVTTYNFMNPGYRTYDVDGGNSNSTWVRKRFKVYCMNHA